MKAGLRRGSVFGLSAFFILAGINHFANPGLYLDIMPPYLPAHAVLVYLSGVFEVLGGVAILWPPLREPGGWGLVVLLLLVFPANIHMALHPELFPEIPAAALYGRLPLQCVLIAWVYWATR